MTSLPSQHADSSNIQQQSYSTNGRRNTRQMDRNKHLQRQVDKLISFVSLTLRQ